MKASILIQAETDDKQIKNTADKAVDTMQKEVDKKRPRVEIEADVKKAQDNFNKALASWKDLRKEGASKIQLKIASDNLNVAATELSKLKRELKETGEVAENAAGDDNKGMGKFLSWLKNTAIWTAVLWLAKKLVSTLIELGTNFNNVSNEFDRFTGNSEKTNALLNDLNSFATSSWLDLNTVRDTATALLEMGVNADNVVEKMQALQGLSAGTGASLEDLTDILKDITEDWKLTADSFNDLVKAGVPIGDQLAKDLGLSVEQVKSLASQGKITDEQVSDAFKHMTEEWGIFSGAMEEYANSFEGRWNTIKTKLIGLGEWIATAVMPAFEGLMEDINNTTDALTETWTQGLNGMQILQKAVYVVATVFRGLVKVIQTVGAVFGSELSGMYTVATAWASDVWKVFTKLFSGDTWAALWNNIKYWIAQGVNGAIDAINQLSEWINQIPGISFWKIWHVERGQKSDVWLFDFTDTANALEGAKMAMQETISDIWEDWSNFFWDVKDWWETSTKTIQKEAKKTKATLKDMIKGGSGWSGSSSGKNSDTVKNAQEELKALRDVKIKEVEDAELSEKQKNERLLDIYDWYKNELIKLEWKTNDELLKSAEQYIKDYYDTMQKASEKEQKAAQESIKNAKKYQDAIEKLGDQREEYKDKAVKNIREVNNSIAELDKEFNNDIANRYNEVQKIIQDFERKNGDQERLKGLGVDTLKNWDSDTISDIKVDDAIEYLNALKESELLSGRLTENQKELAKTLENQSESEKLILQYEQQRAVLEEQKKLYEAFANQWDLANIGKQAIQIEDDIVKYYDATKDQYVEITDFKNQELARDLYNQQIKLQTEYENQQTALNNELELVESHSKKVLTQRQSDTKAYKNELKNRVDAVRDYVNEVQALLASVPSSYRAYGGELNKGVTMVGENWPEAIVRRQSSYVQPRNAVQNYSTVNTSNNNLSINGLQLWNFNTVEDLLAELKNHLTYRN